MPEETAEQLRQRDPLVRHVLCNASHVRHYRASSAREIRLVLDITPLQPPPEGNGSSLIELLERVEAEAAPGIEASWRTALIHL